MISTLNDDAVENVMRFIKSGAQKVIQKPSVVCRYENMDGVGIADHNIATY